MTFSQLGLHSDLLKAIADQNYQSPTPIQQQAIPVLLTGKDVLAAAQTGTGKTAAFTLPLIQKLHTEKLPCKGGRCKVLILTPTRELAAQVANNVETYSKYTRLKSVVAFGGVGINPQMIKLKRGCDFLIATPGRLLDLYQQNAVRFDDIQTFVLDEADRMLDMGFIHDIKRIIKLLPNKRQNLLFSATFSDPIRKLAANIVHEPVEISVAAKNTTSSSVNHSVVHVLKGNKSKLLAELINIEKWQQVLVFSRTKHGANRIAKQLNARDISAAAIHGNKSQGARTKALAEFKSGKVRVLVATDIAARGIDIKQLPQVVNFDLPNVAEDYVHRIGRTGRAGETGQAISFVTEEDIDLVAGIQNLIKQVIEVKHIKGFSLSSPLKTPDLKAVKAKRPKKPKNRRSTANHR
ncbi:DEAD/DEAH box helicase [Ningiella sp. W23]|uniref:DEAD/DEAH box helicase n=1 Tax=Ningiella sp. W23 TaxID=3023715 RepID=UPI0037574CB4